MKVSHDRSKIGPQIMQITKIQILLVGCCLLIPLNTYAELSVTSQWRIEQADHRCRTTGNAITYKEYWGDAVTDDTKETICMAEQFADLVVMDGDPFLEKQGVELIQQCKKQTKNDMNKYFMCLKKNLEQVTKVLSSPCRELGEAQLWEEEMCRRLVSFIFVQRFEKIMEVNRPPMEKLKLWVDKLGNMVAVNVLFNPIMAVLCLIVFIADVVLIVDRGNWTRASKMCIIVGMIILVSCYVKEGLRTFSSIIAILVTVSAVAWNHLKSKFGFDRKKRKSMM